MLTLKLVIYKKKFVSTLWEVLKSLLQNLIKTQVMLVLQMSSILN